MKQKNDRTVLIVSGILIAVFVLFGALGTEQLGQRLISCLVC